MIQRSQGNWRPHHHHHHHQILSLPTPLLHPHQTSYHPHPPQALRHCHHTLQFHLLSQSIHHPHLQRCRPPHAFSTIPTPTLPFSHLVPMIVSPASALPSRAWSHQARYSIPCLHRVFSRPSTF